MSYVRLAGAVVLVLVLLIATWKIDAWRTRAAELDQVQAAYASYRATTTQQLAEQGRRERINREISAGYIGVIQEQSADLADAHSRLAGLGLHVGACPRVVPAAAPDPAATAGAPEAGADRQPQVVDAIGVADRLAACDAVGSRLNALIDWTEKISKP